MDYSKLKRMTPQEIKDVELNLLDQFDSFCNKHNLLYTLDSGTLIGAVRHKGFIPWDDDIDVAMPYPDYLRFIELFEKENNNKNIDIIHGMKCHAGFHFTKMVDTRTVLDYPQRDCKHRFPIWIDIFPMCSIDDNDEVAQNNINEVLDIKETSWKYINYNSCNPLKKIIKYMTNDYFLGKCVKRMEDICFKYPYGSTQRMRIIPIISRGINYAENNHFDDRLLLKFEGKYYYCPKDYDAYLTRCYGDYMKLPPIEKRETHSLNAYWR